MRNTKIVLLVLIAILALTLTACSPSAPANNTTAANETATTETAPTSDSLKDKIVGTYTSSLFSSEAFASVAQMTGASAGDITVNTEFTADGKVRPLINGKTTQEYMEELTKNLSEEQKAALANVNLDNFGITYEVKDDTTVTMTVAGQAADMTASWDGDVLTLTDKDGNATTFTRVK